MNPCTHTGNDVRFDGVHGPQLHNYQQFSHPFLPGRGVTGADDLRFINRLR